MEDLDQIDTPPAGAPEPDPRLVAVQEAADALRAAIDGLPDTLSRMHARAHADAVPIYAAQAIREEAEHG